MPTTPTLPLIHAFRRPAVIAAIAVLLVNDHVLKAAAPSWLTGKLSDFAGLFFFPLLLGALIELAAARFKQKTPYALPLALAFTALLFATIKTLPAANALYTSALGVQVVRDPSDLMALVMLIPAWWVGKQGVGYAQKPSSRAAYAAFALGALASMATSPCMPGTSVVRVEIMDGKLYAGIPYYESEGTLQFAIAEPDALHWQSVNNSTPVLMASPPELPYTACSPSNPTHCYRIDGSAKVQESTDGEQTWRAAWEISSVRETFLRRQPQPGACGKIPELRTYDLVILADGTVVVAAGNEGFVVRKPEGLWQRVGIEHYVYPTPIRARRLGEAFSTIYWEFIYAGMLSLLVYTVLSVWVRWSTARPRWALHPAWFALPWLLAAIALILTIEEIRSPVGGIMLTPVIFFAALIALGLMYLIMGLLIFAEPDDTRRCSDWWAFLAVLSALAVPTAVFLLWAYGIIPPYWLAAVLAIMLTIVALVLIVRQWRRAMPSE